MKLLGSMLANEKARNEREFLKYLLGIITLLFIGGLYLQMFNIFREINIFSLMMMNIQLVRRGGMDIQMGIVLGVFLYLVILLDCLIKMALKHMM